MYEILGYANTWTASPDEVMEFRVSCENVASYQADLVRIRCGDNSPGAPGLKETVVAANVAGALPGRKQETHAGSYARVDAFEEAALGRKTWLLGMMPTLPGNGNWQTVFGRWDAKTRCGYKLAIDPAGCLTWLQGDEHSQDEVRLAKPMATRQWYMVSVAIDAVAGTIALEQTPLSPTHAFNSASARTIQVRAALPEGLDRLPFAIGADLGHDGKREFASAPYNGRIDSLTLLPALADHAQARQLLKPPQAREHGVAPLMAWDFAQEIMSDFIVDGAAPARRGELNHLPARGVPGIRWDTTCQRWVERPDHFAAVHFHDDNLGDAQWEIDFHYRVPADLPSGLYAMRLSGEGKEHRISPSWCGRPPARPGRKLPSWPRRRPTWRTRTRITAWTRTAWNPRRARLPSSIPGTSTWVNTASWARPCTTPTAMATASTTPRVCARSSACTCWSAPGRSTATLS